MVRIHWGALKLRRIRDRKSGRSICCYSCCYQNGGSGPAWHLAKGSGLVTANDGGGPLRSRRQDGESASACTRWPRLRRVRPPHGLRRPFAAASIASPLDLRSRSISESAPARQDPGGRYQLGPRHKQRSSKNRSQLGRRSTPAGLLVDHDGAAVRGREGVAHRDAPDHQVPIALALE